MATKGVIAAKTKQAFERVAEATQTISSRLGLESIDLSAIRYRDPKVQLQWRMEALADWCESIAGVLDEHGIDLEHVQQMSNQMGLIRLVLDRSLNALKLRELKQVAADLGLDFTGSIKQEYVNAIAEHLTGKHIEIVSLEDVPPEVVESDPQLVGETFNVANLDPDAALAYQISDVETDGPEMS